MCSSALLGRGPGWRCGETSSGGGFQTWEQAAGDGWARGGIQQLLVASCSRRWTAAGARGALGAPARGRAAAACSSPIATATAPSPSTAAATARASAPGTSPATPTSARRTVSPAWRSRSSAPRKDAIPDRALTSLPPVSPAPVTVSPLSLEYSYFGGGQ